MDQTLTGDKYFKQTKETSESIGLLKLIKKVCYNYQLHEFAPLGRWDAIDQLCNLKQPKKSPETKHHEKLKIIIEVCKASGISFSVIYSGNINI